MVGDRRMTVEDPPLQVTSPSEKLLRRLVVVELLLPGISAAVLSL